MVGVSDPELRRDRLSGVRLIGGLAGGYLAATVLLTLPLIGVASALQAYVDPRVSEIVLLVLLLGLGVADVLGRTPYRDRQVPKRFISGLRPLPRGLLWGFDLGLLVTTQKTSSLLWAAALGVVLVGPPQAALPVLAVAGAVFLTGVAVLSFAGAGRITGLWFGVVLVPIVQRGAGVLLIGLAVAGMVLR